MQTTPPDPAQASISASGMLRGWSRKARGLEWEKMVGLSVAAENVECGAIAGVGAALDDADAIHLPHEAAAEIGQPIVGIVMAARTREVAAVIDEQHPAHADVAIKLHEADVVAEGEHALDIEDDRELAVFSGLLDVGGAWRPSTYSLAWSRMKARSAAATWINVSSGVSASARLMDATPTPARAVARTLTQPAVEIVERQAAMIVPHQRVAIERLGLR